MCEIEEPCGIVHIDLRRGVPLACIKVVNRDNEFVIEVDDCGPRKLVKRNDMLFDLIRGCDLTKIKAIGWAEFHRGSMPFEKLLKSFKKHSDGGYISTIFHVEFSRPVRVDSLVGDDSLLSDCFAMTVFFEHEDTGLREPFRFPIERIETKMDPNNDALATAAAIVISAETFDELSSGHRRFEKHESLVEIEVRGDYIIDCNGQAVDANAVGLRAAPTGNGSPGGTFLSSFRVIPQKQQQ